MDFSICSAEGAGRSRAFWASAEVAKQRARRRARAQRSAVERRSPTRQFGVSTVPGRRPALRFMGSGCDVWERRHPCRRDPLSLLAVQRNSKTPAGMPALPDHRIAKDIPQHCSALPNPRSPCRALLRAPLQGAGSETGAPVLGMITPAWWRGFCRLRSGRRGSRSSCRRSRRF